jgi:predicted O-methyltransferase YrrM
VKKIEDIKAASIALGVPIILDETVEVLRATLVQRKPKTILEIGSGIGFSASVMRNACTAHITTIEKDTSRYEQLVKILEGTNTTCLNRDAGEVIAEYAACGQTFDFIFLDGPKGQYARYFPILDKILATGGTLFADNVNFHGMVTGETEITKGARTIATSLTQFQEIVRADKNYDTVIMREGDGILIATKRRIK